MRPSDRWLAVADLAGEPEVGLRPTRQVAILFALWPLGEAVACRLAATIAG